MRGRRRLWAVMEIWTLYDDNRMMIWEDRPEVVLG